MSIRTLRAPLLSLIAPALLLVTVTAPSPAGARGDELNGHPVRLSPSGRLLAWNGPADRAYADVTSRAWGYLLTRVPKDENGNPAYLSHSYLDPNSQEPVGWPHNPAGLYAMLIESGLRSYAFSGDARPLRLARRVADHQLDHGMTSREDSWAHVPYASADVGSVTYAGASYGDDTGSGDGTGVIEPDKVGELGHGFVQLYELTGEKRYLDAAVDAADALAAHRRTDADAEHSPWPFRVQAADDVTREPYTASVTGPLELFDDLVRLRKGDTAAYRTARAALWDWTMAYPMANDNWSQYFEDVEHHEAPDDNVNQLTAMMFARYLLEHPSTDRRWESHARHVIRWVERRFGVRQQGGAMTINEQMAFYHPMGSHTARYAAVNALLYKRTGDGAARSKAYRSFNWATYMTRRNGVVIDGPTVGNQWFTDGYGDYVRHFLTGMSAVPAWAPDGQTHVLDSTSVVRKVAYGKRYVAWSTFDRSGTERVKTATTPSSVTLDGRTLRRGAAWSWSSSSHLLVVKRAAGTRVVVWLPRGTRS